MHKACPYAPQKIRDIMKNIKDIYKNMMDINENMMDIFPNIRDIFSIMIGFFLNMRFGHGPTKISIKCYSRWQNLSLHVFYLRLRLLC